MSDDPGDLIPRLASKLEKLERLGKLPGFGEYLKDAAKRISSGQYILDSEGNPVPEPDVIKWAKWFEAFDDRRSLARDELFPYVFGEPSIVVSTVFLGIDHNFLRTGPPILWETMCFIQDGKGHETNPDDDPYSKVRDYQRRYISRKDALEGHRRIVRLVKRFLNRMEYK